MRRSKPSAAPAALDASACTRAALELLARREHSRRELTRKLAARGFPDDVVTPVLDELERTGALANARFTDSFVRSRIAKGQGPQRIRAELAQRGIKDADTDGDSTADAFSDITLVNVLGECLDGFYDRRDADTADNAGDATVTLDAAWAAGRDDRLGTLEPGKWADFILVDRDIFAVEPQRIWSTEVLETWLGGRRVYARDTAP